MSFAARTADSGVNRRHADRASAAAALFFLFILLVEFLSAARNDAAILRDYELVPVLSSAYAHHRLPLKHLSVSACSQITGHLTPQSLIFRCFPPPEAGEGGNTPPSRSRHASSRTESYNLCASETQWTYAIVQAPFLTVTYASFLPASLIYLLLYHNERLMAVVNSKIFVVNSNRFLLRRLMSTGCSVPLDEFSR